ncbi:MAG: transglycosylase SLT domain-containing protein, partial [Actinomycetes bacterium]
MAVAIGAGGLDDLTLFMDAISAQESSGNPTARNAQSGAYGQWQIMPANWAPWAAEAGLGADAAQTAENQRRVAEHKFRQYYQQFGSWDAVAVAWFAGPGRARRYVEGDRSVLQLSDGNMTVGGYIEKMRRGMTERRGSQPVGQISAAATFPDGPFTPPLDPRQRTVDILKRLGDSIAAKAGGATAPTDAPQEAELRVRDEDVTKDALNASLGQLQTRERYYQQTPEGQAAADQDAVSGAAGTVAGDVFDPGEGGWGRESVGAWGAQAAARFGVRVSSHYRDPDHNERVGGATNSDHLWGGGIDFAGDPAALDALAAWARQHTGPDGPFR